MGEIAGRATPLLMALMADQLQVGSPKSYGRQLESSWQKSECLNIEVHVSLFLSERESERE